MVGFSGRSNVFLADALHEASVLPNNSPLGGETSEGHVEMAGFVSKGLSRAQRGVAIRFFEVRYRGQHGNGRVV